MDTCYEGGFLEISRDALRRNAAAVCSFVGVPVIGVLKSDGYGVGLLEAARAWQTCGVRMFAVSRPQEALALRQAGFQEEILLLSPVADAAILERLVAGNILLTVTGLDNARFYLANSSAILHAHVAVDTGMGRFGVRWTDTTQLQALYRLDPFRLRLEGIYSHFSASFEKRYHLTRRQLYRFLRATGELEQAGIDVGLRHIANSCAALRFPDTWLDAVRVGSALVGRLGAPVQPALEEAGHLCAQVVDCKYLQKGDTSGYASLYRVRQDTRAVVVAIGSEDGFGYAVQPDLFSFKEQAAAVFRLLKRNRPCVFYHGTPLPLVGRIGTQFTLFDASGTNIDIGDTVTVPVNYLFPNRRRLVR